MLLRLLLMVLMLMGPLPVRTCTCAASAMQTGHSEDSMPCLQHEEDSCGSEHHSQHGPESTKPADRHTSPDAVTEDSHSPHHDRDCPAVKPRAAVVEAVVAPATDGPVDLGSNLPVAPVLPAGTTWILPRLEPDPGSKSVPLYISLLTLRN